jgi:hypothetical protein
VSAPGHGPGRRARSAAAAGLLAGLLAPMPAPAGADEIGPGAYCPLPEAGEKPACLEPARAEYGAFFEAVEGGGLDGPDTARVEADVAGGGASENAYLALSSLSYGYYRLAQRVAASPEADPASIARLERWSAVLARAYEASADDPHYREAVQTAAADLQRRMRLGCTDAAGEPAACDSAEAVLRGVDAAAGEVGIRGALRRLLERLLGAGGS